MSTMATTPSSLTRCFFGKSSVIGDLKHQKGSEETLVPNKQTLQGISFGWLEISPYWCDQVTGFGIRIESIDRDERFYGTDVLKIWARLFCDVITEWVSWNFLVGCGTFDTLKGFCSFLWIKNWIKNQILRFWGGSEAAELVKSI